MRCVVLTLAMLYVFAEITQGQTAPGTAAESSIDAANRRLMTNADELVAMFAAAPAGSALELELRSHYLSNRIVQMSLEQLTTLIALSERAKNVREPETRKTIHAYLALQSKLMEIRLQEVIDSANRAIAKSPNDATLASLRDLRDAASIVREQWLFQTISILQRPKAP